MNIDRFDKAEAELGKALENGDINEEEFEEEMRNLNAEMREQAEEAAEQAYIETMGW